MFSSNQLNHGVASLQIDEAALLYRLARDATDGPFAEIGRFKGGSTFIFASALPDGVELWSYDLHVALRAGHAGRAARRGAARGTRPLRPRAQGAPDRRRLAQGRAAVDRRSRCCSSTATTRTKARGPTSTGGARSSARAATCSCTTRSTAAATGTSTPGVARAVAEIGRDPEWERQPGRRLDRALRPQLVNLVRGRPELERRRRHARRASLARGHRDDLRRQRLDRRLRRCGRASSSRRSSCSAPARTSASPAATTPASGARSSAAPTGCCC